MSIQQQVLLRHRSDGHLRFSLPAALSQPGIAERLVAGMHALEGVYRVELSPRQGKLSIRYQEVVCGFASVVKRLYALIGDLMSNLAATPAAAAAKKATPLPAYGASAEPGPMAAWISAKIEEVRETLAALGIVAKEALAAIRKRPRWAQDFANDLLMLFLIKLHWHHITTLWMPHPWTYRYEWMATFYLIYLQVQSRLPQRA